MRILYLTDRLSPRGGAGNHLLDVVAAMAPRARITVAAGHVQAELPADIQTHRLRGLSTSVAEDAGLNGLDALLDAADVVHVQNVMNPVALKAATSTGRAVVTVQDHRVFCPGPGRTLPDGSVCYEPMGPATCADCMPDDDYRTRMLALTKARAESIRDAKLIVLSQYMADELAEAGLNGATVIPPPVLTAAAPSAPGRDFVLGGRLVHHKGIDLAAQAWQQAGVSSSLQVAGLGPLHNVVADAKSLGWLDRQALGQTLAEARALIFPSRWQEPFGIMGVEALAQGTPVIAMVQGGMEDWADVGVIRVDPGDVHGMAEAIKQLHDDTHLSADLGTAGWEMVRERYAPSSVNDMLWSIYTATA